jgi:hypothetical protein
MPPINVFLGFIDLSSLYAFLASLTIFTASTVLTVNWGCPFEKDA